MANILIVDSYPAVGLLYREVLEEHGHQVFSASSGREALVVARNETIDIVVVDDTLPDFRAKEILTRVKHIRPRVRSILSISSIFGPVTSGKGWDGVIGKSSDYTILRGEVDRLAGSIHYHERGLQKTPFPDLLSLIRANENPERIVFPGSQLGAISVSLPSTARRENDHAKNSFGSRCARDDRIVNDRRIQKDNS